MFDLAAPPDLMDALNGDGSANAASKIPRDQDLQRVRGVGRVVLERSASGTRAADVYQQFPIRIMFPKKLGGALQEAVIVNSTGGIAGGDWLEFDVTALAGASIAVTSQAAEKVYRALDEPARIRTRLKACESAKFAWLPQETIVFDGARLNRRTEVGLTSGAELLALEWLVLGRAAHGEDITGGHIIDSWRVKKDDRLIWADAFRVADETFPQLRKPALLSDCKAVGTLLYFGRDIKTKLEFVRDLSSSAGCQWGATSVGGLIVLRFAAPIPYDLRLALRSLLQTFGQEIGGAPFRVPKMWSC